jgi:transcriptional regulator with XRE-family HTH domain
MYIGETIDHVRKQKGLTIKQICGEKISRTTYHRFVKEQSDTSIGNSDLFAPKSKSLL